MERKDILKFEEKLDNNTLYENINNFMDFVYVNNLYEFTNNIYDSQGIKDLLKEKIDNYNWKELKYMLDGIEDLQQDYFFLDSNGNLKNVTNQDINYIVSDVLNQYDFGDQESKLSNLKNIKTKLFLDESLMLETKNKKDNFIGCATFSPLEDKVFIFEGDSSGKDDKEMSYEEFLNNYTFELKKELENSKEDYDLQQ